MSKLIKAVFTGRFCKTQRVFQFDTDDKLQIVNVDLPANFTVDFSNSKTGDSVSVLATSDTVQIPPDLFVPGSEIYAWIWLSDSMSDSNGGHTRCEATIPIDPRARRTGTEPTPAQASAWDEAVDTLNEAAADYEDAMGHGPQIIDGYWHIWDAEAGEYVNTNVKAEGDDGSNAWLIDAQYTSTVGTTIRAMTEYLIGPLAATPKYGDILFVSDGKFGNILSPGNRITMASLLGDLHGEPGEGGYSPKVTIETITGGNRVTITDEEHPQGQSFDVMDGSGGSGTVDSDFSTTSENPVQNKVITNALNYASQQLTNLGLALDDKVDKVSGKGLSSNDFTDSDKDALDSAASKTWVQQQGYLTGEDLADYRTAAQQNTIDAAQDTAIAAKYTKPSSGIPKTDLASAVQTSLGKADTALQSAPVTSVNNQTGAVLLSIPSTASDVGAVAVAQGVAHAGEFLVVDSNGMVSPEDNRFVVTLTPTNPDFSGTMDKTPAELAAAYDASKRIIAYAPAFNFACELSLATIRSGGLYTFDFIALGELNGQDIMLRLLTSFADSTYTVKIYPLATGQWTGGSY